MGSERGEAAGDRPSKAMARACDGDDFVIESDLHVELYSGAAAAMVPTLAREEQHPGDGHRTKDVRPFAPGAPRRSPTERLNHPL
jgi:hypothetical protein